MKCNPVTTSQTGGAAATGKPVHFAYIDAVRGLAFLLVFFLHAALLVGPFPGRDFLMHGECGVQLFFIVSVITLCNSMSARQKKDRFPLLFFYLRRLFRIAPLFWAAILLYWAVPGVDGGFWLSRWAPSGVHPSYFVLTALFLHGWHPDVFNSIVPGGWTIAVEMTFYLLFPLIYRLVDSVKKSIVAVVLAVLYIEALLGLGFLLLKHGVHLYPAVRPDILFFFLERWFPCQLPVFIIGFLAYRLADFEPAKVFVGHRARASGLLCLCLGALWYLFFAYHGFIPGYLLVVLALSGIVLVMSGEALPWLSNRLFRHVGKLSYSCYLVHFAALRFALRCLRIYSVDQEHFFNAGGAVGNFSLFVQIFIIGLALTFGISTLTQRWIETPGIALGRKIIQRIAARK